MYEDTLNNLKRNILLEFKDKRERIVKSKNIKIHEGQIIQGLKDYILKV